MSKEIPVEALKAAVQKLNSILEEGKIKTVGKKKIDIVTAFAEKVSEITEAGKAKDLPGECIEFFNSYIVTDDDAADAADTKKDVPAAAGKKGVVKKGAAPAADKKGKGDRRDGERGGAKKGGIEKVGVLSKIHECIVKKASSKEDILNYLKSEFPDRDEKGMKNTINCQLTGKNRPWRLEKSQKVTYVVKDGKFSLSK